MLCFVVVMQSFIMNSHEVFIHIHQGCFAGTGAIVRLPQCQWSKPAGYGKISQCITTTKHSKAKTVCIFLGIYCMYQGSRWYEWHTSCVAVSYILRSTELHLFFHQFLSSYVYKRSNRRLSYDCFTYNTIFWYKQKFLINFEINFFLADAIYLR